MNQQQAELAIVFFKEIRTLVQRRIVGQDEAISGLIAALMTGGHVLLEGNPGLGKTTLAKVFAQSLKLGDSTAQGGGAAGEGEGYGRIQFTPDLLPSDITGAGIPDPANPTKLIFQPGPIFRELLLADEINRATPKTQSAMLEAMAERQVTVMGRVHRLVRDVSVFVAGRNLIARTPFMVVATQNPIDQDGTYDLPEAQADRFQTKLLMVQPPTEDLMRIVEREAMGQKGSDDASAGTQLETFTRDQCLFYLDSLRRQIEVAEVPRSVLLHAAHIVQATNGPEFIADLNIHRARGDELREFVETFVDIPLGPRTAIAIILVAKVHALMATDRAKADQWPAQLPRELIRLAPTVLRHRLKLKMGWEEIARRTVSKGANLTDEALRDRIITRLVAMCAPQDGDYARAFSSWL